MYSYHEKEGETLIYEVVLEKNGKGFDRRIEPSDWRFSATIVGLVRYLDYNHLPYEKEGRSLYYNFSDVDLSQEEVEIKYLRFVEHRFIHLMHHIQVKRILSDDLVEDNGELKLLKDKLLGNTVMKKHFSGFKEPLVQKDDILHVLAKNNLEIIRETFKNSIFGYRKFINQAIYAKGVQERCRLWGFYVDTGRKTKSLGFCFEKAAAKVVDFPEFDFLPFAFSLGQNSVFVNNNVSVDRLLKSNNDLDDYLEKVEEKRALWNNIFYQLGESGAFIAQNVEMILKKVEEDAYHTVILRQSAIETFKSLRQNNLRGDNTTALDSLLKSSIKVTDDYYLNLSEEITDCILNDRVLDDLIEKIFKLDNSKKDGATNGFQLKQLIRVNLVLYRQLKKLEETMEEKNYLNGAYSAAQTTKRYFLEKNLENKMKGYRQKLTSSIVAKDYDRFIEIMLQLSSYTETAFPFLHHLIKDFEGNKNLAYEFINNLNNFQDRN